MVYKPTDQEMADAPKITLGGEVFSIPLLAPRQNRKLIPLAYKFLSHDVSNMAEEDFDTIMLALALGLSRGYPDKTVEQHLETLQDAPITLDEMQAAVQIVFQQTGVLKPAAPGEQAAGSSQTGTA